MRRGRGARPEVGRGARRRRGGQTGRRLDREELFSFLGGRVAKFKMPRIVEFTAEPLPKTGTGKILKRQLRETYWTGKQVRVGQA